MTAPIENGTWARVPVEAAADHKLGATPLRVLIAIARHVDENGRGFPSLDSIARLTKLDRRNVPAALKKLEEQGWITRERRKDKSGDATSTAYTISYPKVSSDDMAGDMPGHDTPAITPHDTVSSDDMTPGVMSGHALTAHLFKQPTEQPRNGGAESFEAFWSAYPRRVGKGIARKVFARALKKIDAPRLIEATQRFAKTCQGKEPEFIPHPSTWLNGERWLDETTTSATGASLLEPDPYGDLAKSDRQWIARLEGFHLRRFWNDDWGPKPGDQGCRVDPNLMERYKLESGSRRLGRATKPDPGGYIPLGNGGI